MFVALALTLSGALHAEEAAPPLIDLDGTGEAEAWDKIVAALCGTLHQHGELHAARQAPAAP